MAGPARKPGAAPKPTGRAAMQRRAAKSEQYKTSPATKYEEYVKAYKKPKK